METSSSEWHGRQALDTVLSSLTVPFCDTDAMGVVHHKNYVKYLEVARVAFVKQRLGSVLDSSRAARNLAVTELSVRYLRAARFDDELQISCRLEWCKTASLAFAYQIFRGELVLSEAQTEHAVVDAEGRLVRVGRALRQALERKVGSAATPGVWVGV